MKKIIYSITMVALAATALSSCGNSNKENSMDTIQLYSTEYGDISGNNDWYIDFASDNSHLGALPTDCDTLFNAAIDVTLRLAEEVVIPENMIAEYKDINVHIYNANEFGDMKPTANSHEAIKELLAGKVGDQATIRFVSSEKHTISEIKEIIEDSDSFKIDDTVFSVVGDINQKEYYKCLFGDASTREVIEDFTKMADNLKIAYDKYDNNRYEDNSDSYLEKANELYKSCERYYSKMYEVIDFYDLPSSQEDSVDEARDIISDIWWEL